MTGYHHPGPCEVAVGYSGCADVPVAPGALTPRAALERAVGETLRQGRCFVSFSGGRDSSAVLAVAAHVARTHGYPLPVPVVLRYPGREDTEESGWQDLVLTHLGLRNAVIHSVDRPEGYLGATARDGLARRGLLWPPALQLPDPILGTARGGVLITGEGGDEVLGARRVTALTLLVRLHRRPTRRLLRLAARALEPGPLRTAGARRRLRRADLLPWLTAEGAALAADRLARDAAAPLRWDRETARLLGRHAAEIFTDNYALVAREHDVLVEHPLVAPGFVHALARAGGPWGYAGRTDLMRRLFSDLLPEALLARPTKAHFGQVRWGGPERDFARAWDGTGLDTRLVDVSRVRAEWLSDRPAGASALALQAAWLAAEGLPVTGRP